jgi:hypothetical protein
LFTRKPFEKKVEKNFAQQKSPPRLLETGLNRRRCSLHRADGLKNGMSISQKGRGKNSFYRFSIFERPTCSPTVAEFERLNIESNRLRGHLRFNFHGLHFAQRVRPCLGFAVSAMPTVSHFFLVQPP